MNVQGSVNEVGLVAALPPPDPSPVEEDGNLPEKAPGDENKLPPQPEPEKESAVPAGRSGAVIFSPNLTRAEMDVS